MRQFLAKLKIYEGQAKDHFFPSSFVELECYNQPHIISVRERYFHTCMLPSLGFEVGQSAEEKKLNTHFSFRGGKKKLIFVFHMLVMIMLPQNWIS